MAMENCGGYKKVDCRIDESDPRDPLLIALLFNECINTGDLYGLCALMTPDHVFIDARGGASRGSTVLWAAWRDFFRKYPDYRNHFSMLRSTGATVSIIGLTKPAKASTSCLISLS